MMQITARAGATTDSNPANTRPIAIRDMSGPPLLFIQDLRTILSSALFNDDAVTAYAVRRLLASPGGPASRQPAAAGRLGMSSAMLQAGQPASRRDATDAAALAWVAWVPWLAPRRAAAVI